MFINKFLKLQASAFIILFAISIFSSLVYEILWVQEGTNYKLYINISAAYIISLIVFSPKKPFKHISHDNLEYLKPTSKSLILSIYLFSACLLFFFGVGKTYLSYDLYIPFANLFILFLLSTPFIFFNKSFKFIIFITASIVTFYTYDTRIYIFFIAILMYVRVKKINLINIVPLILLFLLMIYISFTRTESGMEYNDISFILNSFGAELRDGLFFYDRLSEQQIDILKQGFFYNFITIFPGWSYFGIIDGDVLRGMQLPTILVYELGLDAQGFNGIRTGVLWESYIIFGWKGVILYSMISAGMVRICTRMYLQGEIFLAGIIASMNFYSIVGYIYFSISNLSQFIIFFIIFFKFLPWLLKNAKRIYINNSI